MKSLAMNCLVAVIATAIAVVFPLESNAQCYMDDGKSECAISVKNDKKLNAEYKNLKSNLSKPEIATLKHTQNEWIKWRDSHCNDEVANSGCTNVSCEATSHSYCMATLADKRTDELRKYRANPAQGQIEKFQFSRKIDD